MQFLLQAALTGLHKILFAVNQMQCQNSAGEYVSFPLAMLVGHLRGKLYVPLFQEHRFEHTCVANGSYKLVLTLSNNKSNTVFKSCYI